MTMSDLLALTLRSIYVGIPHKIVMYLFFLFLFVFNKENEEGGGFPVLQQVSPLKLAKGVCMGYEKFLENTNT